MLYFVIKIFKLTLKIGMLLTIEFALFSRLTNQVFFYKKRYILESQFCI